LDIALSHFRQGEWRLAKAAAEATPGWESDLLLTHLAFRTGDPRAATKFGEAARQRAHPRSEAAFGESLLANGEPFLAKEALRHALAECDAVDAGPIGTTLALALRASGAPEAGFAAATRAAAAAEVHHSLPSPEYAEALLAAGACEHAMGHGQKALELLEQARDISQGIQTNHPLIAAALDALGATQRAQNRPFVAVKLHREAIRRWTQALGEHAGVIASSRQSLAQALHRTGDFMAARDEMALSAIQTARCFGADHLDTWVARFELARFELDCGEVEVGLKGMVEAEGEVRRRLGRDHPVVAAMKRWL